MSSKRQLSFVLPAYNEEDNIREMLADVVSTLAALDCDYEIIVVDDGSMDRTAAIVHETAAEDSFIRLISHPVNLGYGDAVLTGLTSANKEFVFFTDSDKQFDLAELGSMFDLIETSDIAVGYRAPRRDPFMRRVKGRGWSLLVNSLFGYTARDIDCAFKLIRTEVVRRLHGKVESRGLTFSAEFLVRAKSEGFRTIELPIRGHRPRTGGSPTAVSLKTTFKAFVDLFRFRIKFWNENRQKSLSSKREP